MEVRGKNGEACELRASGPGQPCLITAAAPFGLSSTVHFHFLY